MLVAPREQMPARALFTRRDAWYAAASLGLVALASYNDRWLTQESTEAQNPNERRLARTFEPIGNPTYVLPVLALGYGLGRITHRPGLSREAVRIGLCIVVAEGGASAIKYGLGRARPYESTGPAWQLKPFSGQTSFPSGHATCAFAVASAIDAETKGKWIPWVVYPAAAMVGWSRVHDSKHWTSDVVAGALLGVWATSKTEILIRRRGAHARSASLQLLPAGDGARVALSVPLD